MECTISTAEQHLFGHMISGRPIPFTGMLFISYWLVYFTGRVSLRQTIFGTVTTGLTVIQDDDQMKHIGLIFYCYLDSIYSWNAKNFTYWPQTGRIYTFAKHFALLYISLEISITFVNFEKAFDSVIRNRLWTIMKERGYPVLL